MKQCIKKEIEKTPTRVKVQESSDKIGTYAAYRQERGRGGSR